MKSPKLIFCECCGEMKPWSTIYHGLQSRGKLMAVFQVVKNILNVKTRRRSDAKCKRIYNHRH